MHSSPPPPPRWLSLWTELVDNVLNIFGGNSLILIRGDKMSILKISILEDIVMHSILSQLQGAYFSSKIFKYACVGGEGVHGSGLF